ncbi:MAG: hypothetical protein F4Z08_01940 [Chloroflexi bacterium]|nr:hypothetical protein [Chloroflexota bacterium]
MLAGLELPQQLPLQESSRHPVVALRSARTGSSEQIDDDVLSDAYAHGLGVFPTVGRAARTVAKLLEWRDQREGLPEPF